ncbi:MAG TPA: hypothetical protein PLN69_10860 [bacterium]|nr:hypothetical protein [bacterium]
MGEKMERGGIDALRTIKPHGRPKKLSEDQLLQIKDLLLKPSLAGECHWTIVKLHGYIRREWQLELGYTTLLYNIEKMGFRQVVPRTWSSKQNAQERRVS